MIDSKNVLDRLQRRSADFGLPGDFYRDPDIFALELELIFYREWLFAAHCSELQPPGSYLTLQIGAYPILLVRGKDGAIRAFINSCRHRGARICPESRGVAVVATYGVHAALGACVAVLAAGALICQAWAPETQNLWLENLDQPG